MSQEHKHWYAEQLEQERLQHIADGLNEMFGGTVKKDFGTDRMFERRGNRSPENKQSGEKQWD